MQNCRSKKSFLQFFFISFVQSCDFTTSTFRSSAQANIYRSISKRKRCGGQYFERKFTPHNVSHVMCHMSRVLCQVLGVKYPFGACGWSVCYQQDLPRLFMFLLLFSGHRGGASRVGSVINGATLSSLIVKKIYIF